MASVTDCMEPLAPFTGCSWITVVEALAQNDSLLTPSTMQGVEVKAAEVAAATTKIS